MASAAKIQKDKFHGSPRFAPRATTASTARAVRNANNRAPQPKLPSRAAPSLPKPEDDAQNNPQQSESLPDDKATIKCIENDIPVKELNKNEEHNLPSQDDTNEPDEECAADTTQAEKEGELNNFGGDSEESQENYNEATAKEENKTSEDFETSQKSDNDRSEIESSAKNSVSSRPQTPKSVQMNLSRSPKAQSRPVTPIKSLPRTMPTNNRPNKPNQSSLPRPKTTPALKSCIRPQSQSNNSQLTNANYDPDDISTIFMTKQKEFHRMKKELDLKQQNLLEIYNLLHDIRERMVKEGKSGEGEGINLQDLMIFNVADWANEEVSQLCRNNDSTAEGAGEIIGAMTPIGDEILSEWNTKVLNLPGNFADVCLQAFTARQEVIDWVKEIIANQEAINEEDLSRITIYNKQGLELCDMLKELKTLADEYLQGVTQLLKQACHEREMLLIVGESLVKEVAHMRQDITLNTAATMEMNAMNAAESDARKALEDTRRELEEERAAKAVVKDKLTTTESQLRQSRIRVNKMDKQLREAEASIASLTITVKSLEDQSRQKEVQLEARARKLKESLKTGEMTNSHIVQQRDVLQTELAQLKEQLQRNTLESKSIVQELNNQIKQLKLNLEAERNTKHEEIELKLRFEDSYRKSLNTIDELKMKVAEFENNKRNQDLPTETEMELRAELLATKETLRVTEEEMIVCKREKLRFLETLTKITESDNKMGMQQKLAAELVSKEEIMSKMQQQIRELTKNIKINEQKVLQYEQYVRDMHTCNLDPIKGQESFKEDTHQELQQEILKLRMGLLEAAHKNEELTEILMQKDQELEQQDKTSRAQARVIKIREELINMLKNKETEQSRELSMLQQDLDHRMKIVDEVNKQIAAKAEEIQELFSTLENKQQQIHRLEKIVLALEEQQRRAQAQRTRHEEKIAALEHELAAGGIRRERKFLFF